MDGTAFVGSTSAMVRSSVRPDTPGYVGCIEDVVVNGISLNPTSTSAIVTVGVVVCESCGEN